MRRHWTSLENKQTKNANFNGELAFSLNRFAKLKEFENTQGG